MPLPIDQVKASNFRNALIKNPKDLVSLYKSVQSQSKLRRIVSGGVAGTWRIMKKDVPRLRRSHASVASRINKKRKSPASGRLFPNTQPLSYTRKSMNAKKNVRNSWRKVRLQPKKVAQRIPDPGVPKRAGCTCSCSRCNTKVSNSMDYLDDALLKEYIIAHSLYNYETAKNNHHMLDENDDNDEEYEDEPLVEQYTEYENDQMNDDDDQEDDHNNEQNDNVPDSDSEEDMENESETNIIDDENTQNDSRNVNFMDFTDNEIYFLDE